MKKISIILSVLLVCFAFINFSYCQEDKADKKSKKEQQEETTDQTEGEEEECKVLLPSIADNYEGSCKKGLAHGKGKAWGVDKYEGSFKKGYPHGYGLFEYNSGDLYDGQFKNGLKDGEGVLHAKIENRDTILAGIWVDDFYIGPKPQHPRVVYKYGVDSHSFKRVRDGERFLIEIFLNGMANSDLENFTIVSTSGTQFQMGRWLGFENCIFPVQCKVSYKTWNKLRTARHEVIFEFELPEPGDWMVRIIN